MWALALAPLALASCWRGPASEPVESTPPPVPAKHVERPDPPRQQTRVARPRPPIATSSSPGPLAMVHQAWDDPSGCMQCHVSVGAGATLDNTRCLGCHDHRNVAARIATAQGFHASSLVAGKRCETCHQEHRGARFDLRGWRSIPGGEARFDHALAGWPLPAAYRSMRCTQCHVLVDSQGLQLYLGLDRAQFP